MTANDIDSIQNLLLEDIDRMRFADARAQELLEEIDRAFTLGKSESDVVDRSADLRKRRETASEARQSFSARTEMLQFIDLGDITPQQLIASVVGTPGGAGGVCGNGGTPAAGEDSDPEATHTLMTAADQPKTFDRHIADQLNSQR